MSNICRSLFCCFSPAEDTRAEKNNRTSNKNDNTNSNKHHQQDNNTEGSPESTSAAQDRTGPLSSARPAALTDNSNKPEHDSRLPFNQGNLRTIQPQDTASNTIASDRTTPSPLEYIHPGEEHPAESAMKGRRQSVSHLASTSGVPSILLSDDSANLRDSRIGGSLRPGVLDSSQAKNLDHNSSTNAADVSNRGDFHSSPIHSAIAGQQSIPEISEIADLNLETSPTGDLLPPLAPSLSGRKCLVLDLDETLVHSSFKFTWNADFVVPVEIEGTVHDVYVVKRPGVDEFLARVVELYEVVVFTASVSKYGDPLLDKLDPNGTVHHRLFRESCYNFQGSYIKNLAWLGRSLESVVIVDNSPAAYAFQPFNAVPISSWFSDMHDNELLDMIPFLEDLSGKAVSDVSTVLRCEW